MATARRVSYVMWGAFVAAVGVYVFVAHLIGASGGRPALTTFAKQIYNPGIIVLTVAMLGAMLLTERVRLARLQAGPTSEQIAAAVVRTIVMAQLMLAELVAVFGLMYFFQGGPFDHMLHFCYVSWAMMLYILIRMPSCFAAAQQAMAAGSPSL